MFIHTKWKQMKFSHLIKKKKKYLEVKGKKQKTKETRVLLVILAIYF